MNITENWKYFIVIPVLIALVIGYPILMIWSLNTLFGLGIIVTFKTWLATFVLGLLITAKSRGGSDEY